MKVRKKKGATERWRPKRRERVVLQMEREICVGRREKVNKISKRNYSIDVRTVLYLRQYCSSVPNFLAFNTLHEGLFLVFGMPNAKYLTFGTLDENAPIRNILRYSRSIIK